MTRRELVQRLAAAGLLAAGGVSAHRLFGPGRNRYYQGPESAHFDGVRFRNPGGPEPRGLTDLLRWQTSRNREAWPERDPSPHRDRPPPRVEGADLRIAHVGHASFLVQVAGRNLLVDPVWSERASPLAAIGPRRVNDPGIVFQDLPPIDVVLVTHNHYDHLDIPTLRALHAGHRPRFLAPLGNDAIIRRAAPDGAIEAMDWGDAVELGPGLRVHLEPALHWSARGLADRNHALWGSFVLETPAGGVYCVGDSGFGDGSLFREVAARHAGLRMALLPIGAYEPRWFMRDQHMNPDEAVLALQACGAETAIAHHWGTFQLTDEWILDPVDDLEVALASHEVPESRFQVLRPGQVWEV
jgi:L-ascorbate metabolism protein UlaG (beta-lactamase superfamily)